MSDDTPYSRVFTESKKLAVKIENLNAFIEDNPAFQKLGLANRVLLARQHELMVDYLDILNARLSLWKIVDL